MNYVIEIYSRLTNSEIDSNTNFLDSLEYLENGLRLTEILNNIDGEFEIIEGFKSGMLYDKYNEFTYCIIKLLSGSLLLSSNNEYTVEELQDKCYKIELCFN